MANLPKPVPYRMKPKKKFLSLKGRRNIAYILALLTLAYIIFSTTGDSKKTTPDYQLALPNEFVGIQKGKMTDYDHLAEDYVDADGSEVDFEKEMKEGNKNTKKVYNIKEPKGKSGKAKEGKDNDVKEKDAASEKTGKGNREDLDGRSKDKESGDSKVGY